MINTYDKTVGYSSLECVDLDKLQQLVTINKSIIDNYFNAKTGDLILVAGAGLGYEGLLINTAFGLKTVSVDININPSYASTSKGELYFQKQDLTMLAFPMNTFSLIYSYHVLEHVDDHKRVLEELHRVLRPGGVMFIGFPNKNRLFSYIGTSQKASLLEKIKWNAYDYLHRIRGTFENECGAHAGFTDCEFIADISKLFNSVYPVRNQYMLTKYSKLDCLMKIIIKSKLAEIIFPSNYYICIKE